MLRVSMCLRTHFCNVHWKNMAFPRILLISIVSLHVYNGNAAFAFVECETENVGQYGQTSLLECTIKTRRIIEDLRIRTVTWKKEGLEEALLVFFKGSIRKALPGYSFADPSWTNRSRNVSLLISNTTVHHRGGYSCEVMTDSGGDEKPISTSLDVRAKYSVPTIISHPEIIAQNTDGTLVCKSDGGYPKGELGWFDERGERIKSETEATETESGLFQLSSKLTLKHGSVSSRYTCAVLDASGHRQDKVQFTLPSLNNGHTEERGADGRSDSVSSVLAPVVVIGSLIVGLLAVLVFCKRRSLRRRRGTHREITVEKTDHLFEDRVAEEAEQIT